jgi:hypothetical protein
MVDENHFGRVFFILILAWIACAGLSWLPDDVTGLRIKKVDMLADIRSGNGGGRTGEVVPGDSLALFGTAGGPDAEGAMLTKRDSLYDVLMTEMGTDTAQLRIRDFSTGHTGLHRFFRSLNGVSTIGRPVRIAFMGDSFIEGDIMVADFRSKMQALFGGRGVGFVPVSSVAEQYRPTIRQRSKGWKVHSIMSDKKNRYILSGLLFDCTGEEASVSFKTTEYCPGLGEVSSLKFFYSRNPEAEMELISNDARDTLACELPATDSIIRQFEMRGSFENGDLRFRHTTGLQALGIALEDNTGVVVDNFSLRGNSGTVMMRLDRNSCRTWSEIRPYDLIILQYGLNVATESVREYKWYRDDMIKTIRHLQACFPDSDILLLGVSDRSYYHNGAYRTMPSVMALWNTQYKTAEEMGIPFWSIFHAMGGEDSMVRFVKNHWASKDYTHLSFRGGREIATALFDALILEKTLYDEVEEVLD